MADKNKDFDLEEILSEVTGTPTPSVEEPPKKPVFELHLDLDSEYGDIPDPVPSSKPVERPVPTVVRREIPAVSDEDEESVHTPKKEKKKGLGCLKGLIYAIVVLGLSGALAYVLIVGGIDFTGILRGDTTVDITVPAGASTQEVAALLKENGLIDQELFFRVYAKLAKIDGKWQPGDFSVQPNMGYKILGQKLQTMTARKTTKVTIPEGFTVKQIAERLEKKGVCTVEDFYAALRDGDYSDFDFIADLSKVDPADYEARYYKMEGYLFPDTYEFYVACSGETVVRKMLQNFDTRLSTALRSAMKTKNLTMDQLIILASIVQGEAASQQDMVKVARVLWNRMENTDVYPKLQCDSTRDYVTELIAGDSSITISNLAFDTYEREGLPAGAINNPGLDAIKAVLTPSEDEEIMKCYFFATDYDTGKTYFSKTYNQHVNICKKYGIGMYG